MVEEILWLGSPVKRCDLCPTELTEVFYDTLICSGGWFRLCQDCRETFGYPVLGPGLGQKFEYRASDGAWVKTEG